MVGNFKKQEKGELITAEEATRISKVAGDLGEVLRARDLLETAMQAYGCKNPAVAYALHEDIDFLFALSSVYIGGRIQGIREQREAAKAIKQ